MQSQVCLGRSEQHLGIFSSRSSLPGGLCSLPPFQVKQKPKVSGVFKISQRNNKYTLKKCVIELESGSLKKLFPNIWPWKLCNIKKQAYFKFIMSTHIPTTCIHT